jgi:two-component system, NtrC family, response regulator AtoC
MRMGAADFLSKPVDPEALVLVLARAKKAGQSKRITEYSASRQRTDGAIFFGAAMHAVKAQLELISTAEARLETGIPPVLIEGETGTGKTTVARWLHNNSRRAERPYVDVNCSALPEQLAESELFGHERGAFTDAKEARIGLFEAADGGTLFLDEIASLSPALQAKVLKAVEEGRVRRVGSSRDIPVDVRLIAASNRDLQELVAEGTFREDLYHRLDLLRVKLPPLRDWGEDIGALADHIVTGMARKYRLANLQISQGGRRRLMAWRWPGNVRELAHEIERAVVLSMGSEALDFSNLPCVGLGGTAGTASNANSGAAGNDWFVESFRFPDAGGFDMEAAILRIITHAMQQTGGNVSAAARLLGVPRDYIRYRLKTAKA